VVGTATARKLATIVWNMLSKKVPYQCQEEYLFPIPETQEDNTDQKEYQ